MNPTLYKNRAFKEQVKVCFKHKFGPDTTSHINKILQKKNTRVLALVIFYESGKTIIRKLFRVLSCVIYTIIDKYVCIDYLGTEKLKISDLNVFALGQANIMVWITTTYSELVFKIYY